MIFDIEVTLSVVSLPCTPRLLPLDVSLVVVIYLLDTYLSVRARHVSRRIGVARPQWVVAVISGVVLLPLRVRAYLTWERLTKQGQIPPAFLDKKRTDMALTTWGLTCD